MSSYLAKLQHGLQKAGAQATQAASDLSRQASQGGQSAMSSFSLEKECVVRFIAQQPALVHIAMRSADMTSSTSGGADAQRRRQHFKASSQIHTILRVPSTRAHRAFGRACRLLGRLRVLRAGPWLIEGSTQTCRIPREVLHRAKGLAIFTVVKAVRKCGNLFLAYTDLNLRRRALVGLLVSVQPAEINESPWASRTLLCSLQGFVWSVKGGSGIVIARLPDGSWSAPSCIGTGGVGVGLQIGAVSLSLSFHAERSPEHRVGLASSLWPCRLPE